MISATKLNVKAFQELVLYYLRERITHKNLEVKLKVKPQYFEQIPIPSIDKNTKYKLIELVEKVVKLKMIHQAVDLDEIESKIDKLVYQLYDLTEDEIKIIEGNYRWFRQILS